jgi:hypothetical protein
MGLLPLLIKLFEFCVKNNLAGVAIGGFVSALGLVAIGMSRWLTYHGWYMEIVGMITFVVGIVVLVSFFIVYMRKNS